MDIFLLYLFTRIDNLQMTLLLVLVGIFVWCLANFISTDIDSWGESRAANKKATNEAIKKRMRWTIPLIVALVVIPGQKDMAIILAGSAVLDVARSETAGRLASKSVQLIEQTLDGYLKKPEGK